MIRHIESTVQTNTVDAISTEMVVPRNTDVSFLIKDVNRKGEIIGTFEYEGEKYNGILQNVSIFNRNHYRENFSPVDAVVRNLKNGRYTLIEKYKFLGIKGN